MVLSGLRVDIRNAARCSSAIAFGSRDKVNLIMTKAGESVNRISVMGRGKRGGLRLIKAAELMGSSYRQAKRVWEDTVPVGEGVRSWRPTFSRLGLGASAETLGAGCGPADRRGGGDAGAIVSGGNAGCISGRWCSKTAAFTTGRRSVGVRMPDAHDRRRGLDDRRVLLWRRDDLVGCGHAAQLDEEIRNSADTVHRLGERVCAGSHRVREAGREGTSNAVLPDVSRVGIGILTANLRMRNGEWSGTTACIRTGW
jgi:hypothetical protein